jgi:hypothetical protein
MLAALLIESEELILFIWLRLTNSGNATLPVKIISQ